MNNHQNGNIIHELQRGDITTTNTKSSFTFSFILSQNFLVALYARWLLCICPIEAIKPLYNLRSIKNSTHTRLKQSNPHFMICIYYASYRWTSDGLHQKSSASLIVLC
jgi:hypothetical protein